MKRSAIKLLSVVSNKGMWDTESAYYRAPKKFYHFIGGNSSECLGFGPFGEIVYCDKKESPLSFSRWHGSDDVNPPFREWPGRSDQTELFRGVPHHPSEPLALVALSNQPDRVLVHRWSVISGSRCLVC